MHRLQRHLTLLFVGCMALMLTDCRWVKMKLGIGTDFSDPAEGEPEWVVHQALKAALDQDEAKGWDLFQRLLHTDQRTNASLKQWREFKFRDFRKKVSNYIKDPQGPTFTVMRWLEEGERGDTMTLFVESTKTDMPTPCTVRIDDDQQKLWKITRCSL